MIDLKFSPPREGNRGGREQFKWEDLKGHDLKDREYYLGHSVKVGLLKRKNTFYKHDWYLQSDSATSKLQQDEELELTKKYEDEIMQEMLGMKPKRLMLLKSKPTSIQQLRAILETPESTTLEGDSGGTQNETDARRHDRNFSIRGHSPGRNRSGVDAKRSADLRRKRHGQHRSGTSPRRSRRRSKSVDDDYRSRHSRRTHSRERRRKHTHRRSRS